MEYRFKKPKCTPCEFEEKSRLSKNGEWIAILDKCCNCDYRICNFEIITEKG